MVFFNYALRKLNAKIVYYGPGLCGKTTNLQWIHDHFEGGERGELLSLATEGDRTIFFDLLPLDIGTIRGMEVTLQLYTVPGQVHYNSTRQLVLRGADGVVFVADSQRAMLQSNMDSWRNLKENLLLQGIKLQEFPHVLQFNKRDLADICTVEELDAALNEYSAPFYEAIAIQGIGVQETLEGIVKLVMRSLRERYEAELGAAAPRPATTAWRPPEPARPVGFAAPPAGSEPDQEAVTHPEVRAEPSPPPPSPPEERDREPTLVLEPEATGLPAAESGAAEAPLEEPEAAAETGPVEAAIPSLGASGEGGVAGPEPAEDAAAGSDVAEEASPAEPREPVDAAAELPEEPTAAGVETPPVREGPAEETPPAPSPEPEELRLPEEPAGPPGAGVPAGAPPAPGQAAEPEPEAAAAVEEPVAEGDEVPFGPETPVPDDEAPFGREEPEVGRAAAEPAPAFLPETGEEGGAPPWLVGQEPAAGAEEPAAAAEPEARTDSAVGGVAEAAAAVVPEGAAPPDTDAEPAPEPERGAEDRGAAEPFAGPEEPAGAAVAGAVEAAAPEVPSAPPAPAAARREDLEAGEGVAAAELGPAGAAPGAGEPFVAPAAHPGEPFSTWDGDPFGEPAVAPGEIAPVTARAVEVSPEGNQLSVRLEGTRALAEYGQVRELDLVVPVPGGWIGNRRVTLQLRLTLVPEAEES